VKGVARDVGPSTGLRFVCYCNDCQAFAHFLERPDALDAAGGTDIFQMPAGRVALTTGADALRCIQLSDKVLRWYSECCTTPIGNTATRPGFPIVAVIHSFMDHTASGRSRDDALGPRLCCLFARSATGPLPEPVPPPLSFGVFARRTTIIFGAWWRGLGRPSPFFDERTEVPVAEPRVLSASERSGIRSPPPAP
jgi:hypothetical protein